MSKLRKLASFALAIALGAVAAPSFATSGVEIVSPAAGARLPAGGRVAVEWRTTGEATPAFAEWEAFLSLDGGRSWPFRLTPHLDRARTRFEVELPPVPTPRALLLLRFGDERRERELAPPVALTLAPVHGRLELTPPRLAVSAGEAARPGAAGVRSWVDGPRDGRRTVRWETGDQGWADGAPRFADGVETTADCPDDPHRPLPEAALRPGQSFSSTSRGPRGPHRATRALAAADRLSRLSRRNE